MKILLVANKADLEAQREVSIEKGREMAKSWQLEDNAFQEVSATRPVEIKVVGLFNISLNQSEFVIMISFQNLFESIIRMLEYTDGEQEGKKICTISWLTKKSYLLRYEHWFDFVFNMYSVVRIKCQN